MNPRQLLIVLGVALAGFGAAFALSSASGGAEPVAAGKQPAPADVIDVGQATVTAAAPAGGDLPSLRVPVKKKPVTPTAPSSDTGTPVAPTTDTTPAPTTPAPAPTTPAPAPTAAPPTDNGGGGGGGGGFQTIGGED